MGKLWLWKGAKRNHFIYLSKKAVDSKGEKLADEDSFPLATDQASFSQERAKGRWV